MSIPTYVDQHGTLTLRLGLGVYIQALIQGVECAMVTKINNDLALDFVQRLMYYPQHAECFCHNTFLFSFVLIPLGILGGISKKSCPKKSCGNLFTNHFHDLVLLV